ncbi:MAG: oligosaccharide flippase family protein [Chloroflexi bacterium]|nr:oligosaccharide flippase family protein [Chloroflexota bacterium]MBP8058421.1 oligosaccharide flippase family protein [Chloroflexota bacterium]
MEISRKLLSHWQQNRRLTQNTVIKLSSELVGRVASFLLTVVAARWLGEATFGWYNYGLALGFVVTQLADMGLQLLISREVAVRGRQAQPFVQTAFHLKLFFSLPVIALLIFVTGGQDGSIRLSLILLGLMLLSQTYLEFVGYVFRGQQALWPEAWLTGGARLLTAGAGFLVLYFGGNLLLLTVSGTLAVVGVTLVGLWQLHRSGWLYFPTVRGILVLPHSSVLMRQALPLGVSIFLSIAYTRLGVLLLQYQLGETAVAQFSAAARLVEPMQIIPASLLAATFPLISLAWQENRGRAIRLGWQLGLFLASCGLGLALVFWLAAAWLIPWLYGPAYPDTVAVLQLLALSLPLAFINFTLTHHLIARQQQSYIVWFNLIMLSSHALFTWRLIPRQGVVAPAISVIVAEGFLLCACLLTLSLTQREKVTIQVPKG